MQSENTILEIHLSIKVAYFSLKCEKHKEM